VAENIAQTNENIDTQKLWDCIEKAGLTQTIQKLPKGLDTHVGREVYLDGVLFSGGQTQRLMLARALYKDGAILLLDEPTNDIDVDTLTILEDYLAAFPGPGSPGGKRHLSKVQGHDGGEDFPVHLPPAGVHAVL